MDRPIFEIEITEEMIAAGTTAFLDYDSRYEWTCRETVIEIFEVMLAAMLKVHPLQKSQTTSLETRESA